MNIFIPGNVPSSKNSKTWTGKFLVHSKTTQKYIKGTKLIWQNEKKNFLKMIKGKEPPYHINFEFIRGSRHKFDYVNPLQTVQDLMVTYNWLEDDNCEFIIPYFSPYSYNKENPGVYIMVM